MKAIDRQRKEIRRQYADAGHNPIGKLGVSEYEKWLEEKLIEASGECEGLRYELQLLEEDAW